MSERCIVCKSDALSHFGGFGTTKASVTSDSLIAEIAVDIHQCRRCGHIQKVYDSTLEHRVEEIYKAYKPHSLSNDEPRVFLEGAVSLRSERALEKCRRWLPLHGRLLDIGTGNGTVIKSAGRVLPEWRVDAFDVYDGRRDQILGFENVTGFYCGELSAIPEEGYDLIVMWHVLEHVRETGSLFAALRTRLKDDGFMLIQVPCVERNPFDMATVDHCSHFSNQTLIRLLNDEGFEVVLNGNSWTDNCLTLLLRHRRTVDMHIGWLDDTLALFQRSCLGGDYYIFGTGTGALWIESQMEHRPLAFIDEDQSKIGKQMRASPVISPVTAVHKTAKILMPYRHRRAMDIIARLIENYTHLKVDDFVVPEPISDQWSKSTLPLEAI